jgi:hypothetical protein
MKIISRLEQGVDRLVNKIVEIEQCMHAKVLRLVQPLWLFVKRDPHGPLEA